LAAVPSIGRAVRVDGAPAPEADLTRALYEQYANQIFRYCLHQLGSREEAEDAVQSTFLNAFRGIKRGVVPELESAWLFKIAHNVCLSRRRSSWRRDRIESPVDFDLVEELTPAPSRRADELMGLQDVLEQMPENQRRAILLREWQGLSYREIAGELELSQAAVETLIFRARRSLAQGLEQPPEQKRRRMVRGADLGNLLAGLKTLLLGTGAAVKVAATVAVVSATTVVATAPVVQHQRAHARHTTVPTAPTAAPATVPSPAPAPRLTPVPAPRHRALRVLRASPAPAPAVSGGGHAQPAPEPPAGAPPAPAPAPAPDPAPPAAVAQTAPPVTVAAPDAPKREKGDQSAATITTPVPTQPKDNAGRSKGHDGASPAQPQQQTPAPAPVPVVDGPAQPQPLPADKHDGGKQQDPVAQQQQPTAPPAQDETQTTPTAPGDSGRGHGNDKGR
jgi:RNA polymerase sigma factor (sigma-70 family)